MSVKFIHFVNVLLSEAASYHDQDVMFLMSQRVYFQNKSTNYQKIVADESSSRWIFTLIYSHFTGGTETLIIVGNHWFSYFRFEHLHIYSNIGEP